jgi:PAS domain S-box-containing protein
MDERSGLYLLNALLDSTHTGILVSGEDDAVILANQAFWDLFGMKTPANLQSLDASNLMTSLSGRFIAPEHFIQRSREIQLKRTALRDEHFLCTNGRTFKRSYTPVELAPGRTVSLWQYEDITIMPEDKGIVVENEKKYEQVLNSEEDVFLQTDLDGHITFLNKAWEQLMGYPVQECIGTPLLQYIAPDEVRLHFAAFEQLITRQTPYYRSEIKYLSRSGNMKLMHVFMVALFDVQSSRVIGITGTMHDISRNRKDKEMYEVLSNNVKDLICLHDKTGKYIYVSPSARNLTGYSPEELIGQNPYEYFHQEDFAQVFESHRLALRKEDEDRYTSYRFRTRNGTYRWFEISTRPLLGDNNEVIGLVSSSRSIDERKRYEERLLATNELLNSITETQNEYIQQNNAGTSFHILLQHVLKLTGSEHGFIAEIRDEQAEPHMHAISPLWTDQAPGICKLDTPFGQAMLSGTKVISNDVAAGTIPGDPQHIRTFLAIPVLSGKHLLGIFALANRPEGYDQQIIDYLTPIFITTSSILESEKKNALMKKTQAELEKSKWDLFAIVTSLDDIVFEFDEELRFINVWCSDDRILFFPREEFIGKQVTEIGTPEVAAAFSLTMRRVFETGRAENIEYPAIVDGKELWYNAKFSLIKSMTESRHLSALIQDITERKNAEKEVFYAFEKQKQLIDLKSRFISMTSHEFKTPLSSIRSSAELIDIYSANLDAEQQQPFKKHAGNITNEADRLNALINDILMIGKTEAQQISYNPMYTDIRNIASQIIIRQLATLKESRNIELITEGAERKVYVDPLLFDHIIDNLVSNALKYSQGKPDPQLLLRFETHSFCVIIKDHGIGIPKNEIPELFTSFYRAKNVRNIPGNGVGMVVIKHFVDIHKGTMHIESKVNAGTTITICLSDQPD